MMIQFTVKALVMVRKLHYCMSGHTPVLTLMIIMIPMVKLHVRLIAKSNPDGAIDNADKLHILLLSFKVMN